MFVFKCLMKVSLYLLRYFLECGEVSFYYFSMVFFGVKVSMDSSKSCVLCCLGKFYICVVKETANS